MVGVVVHHRERDAVERECAEGEELAGSQTTMSASETRRTRTMNILHSGGRAVREVLRVQRATGTVW